MTRAGNGVIQAACAARQRRQADSDKAAVVALEAHESLKDTPRQYLNRLSDLLFVLARVLNRANLDGLGGDDVYWHSERLKRAESDGS